ncbi:MAG: glutamyl-tRNA reductase [Bacteroidales bacterium]|jgi:glutamyl-tRNA reductase|nr:glutamyl-tRNA reductase [Bacteroidales bacterium]
MIQYRHINNAEYGLAERELLSNTALIDKSVPHVLLATCNRTEVYWGEGEVPPALLRHLYRVASGLESSLTGERAIQGQLKSAYMDAAEKYRLSSPLNRLFQSAMHTGKRVRTETKIARGAVSHSQVTVDMLKRKNIDLNKKIVSIIGVNKLTEDILKYLTAGKAVNVFLSNRSFEKAEHLAQQCNGTAMHLSNKRQMLALSDVLICATSAPHTLVRKDDIPEEKEMLIFDLAFPRDVEECVGKMPGITLYNLDDIERFAAENRRLRISEIAKAEQIIEEEMNEFYEWQKNRIYEQRKIRCSL